ncbi:hypothetical protein [Methanobacterium sp.]|uniref:hypothetical protein n=1 Tax=Methanobacterium sp. TaxID=2164 RepID=UPI002ABB0594|nr:hypothetical protein [Methanobacterium sp.]MDY9922795.1 hypothetical protein [Methanobacterium sp.]
MTNICFKTGWDEEYAYELDMLKIYDIIYRDLEYFPAGAMDLMKDKEARIRALRGGND